MSTPTGRPVRPASAFDYAPKRMREQWDRGDTSNVEDTEPAYDPPRDLDEDPRTVRSRENGLSSLVPTGPHENPEGDWEESEDERAERWVDEPEHRTAPDLHADADADDGAYDTRHEAYDTQYEEEDPKDVYDEHLERLAATLRSLQGENDATSSERPAPKQDRPARGLYAADPADREVYIDGTRLPRFLQAEYAPPAERGGGIGHLGAMLAVGIACVVAAPVAYYAALGNPFVSVPRAIQAKPGFQYAVASTSESLPRPEQQGAPIAGAVAPNAPVAWAEPQPLEPQAQPPASLRGPRSVPLTHVARWPDAAQDSGATQPPLTASTAPTSEPPRADAAPETAPKAYALAAVPPSAEALSQPPQQRPPALDADEIALLLKQGQDFIASGDFVTARVVLRRAAEAGAAAAALALGQTYDPKALAKMRARGVASDAAEARRWYETAQRLGSDEAAQRLARLAGNE